MERLAVFLFVLVTQCQCFLLDEGTQFTHPADSGDRKVFEFYWDLTWETSMLFTDANDGTWVSFVEYLLQGVSIGFNTLIKFDKLKTVVNDKKYHTNRII